MPVSIGYNYLFGSDPRACHHLAELFLDGDGWFFFRHYLPLSRVRTLRARACQEQRRPLLAVPLELLNEKGQPEHTVQCDGKPKERADVEQADLPEQNGTQILAGVI
jgi:hypothetical protein